MMSDGGANWPHFVAFDGLAPPEVAAEPEGGPNVLLLVGIALVFEVGVLLGFLAGWGLA